MRTLDELSLDVFLPDGGARDILQAAANWTDVATAPKHFDPFISLSLVHASFVPSSSAQIPNKPPNSCQRAHRMIDNQLINLISKKHAIGHVGADNGLNYMPVSYYWGLTMEKVGG